MTAAASFSWADCEHCGFPTIHTTAEHEVMWERDDEQAWLDLIADALPVNDGDDFDDDYRDDHDDDPKPPARVVDHPARVVWLAGVERETAEHRERKARGHERAARRKRSAARLGGYSERYAAHKATWHFSRAKGQRERFDSVRGCEERTQLQIVCTACGLVAEHGTRCRIGIVCVSCRGKIASQRRHQFARARKAVLDKARLHGLLYPKRVGGHYSEKLLTLTVPHLAEHDVRTRIRYVLAAWPYFLKRVNQYLRERGEDRAEWLRHAEWTIGGRPGFPGDGQGHPHMHVWFFGPFLPHKREDDRLTEWWREALVRVGFAAERGSLAQRDALEWLRVRTDPVKNGKVDEGGGIVTEVIKYMTKDIIKPGVYVAPEVYARVYEELDGRRPLQASKGFMALGKEEVCCAECGAEKSYLVRLRREGEGEKYGPWMGSVEAHRAHALAQGPPPIAAPFTANEAS